MADILTIHGGPRPAPRRRRSAALLAPILRFLDLVERRYRETRHVEGLAVHLLSDIGADRATLLAAIRQG